MPATSQQQQKLFGLALSVKRGETPRNEVSDEVLNIVDTMSEKKIKDFAETSHKGLPTKVETAVRNLVRETFREKVLGENKFIKPKDEAGVRTVKAIHNNINSIYELVIGKKKNPNEVLSAFSNPLINSIKQAIKHNYKPNSNTQLNKKVSGDVSNEERIKIFKGELNKILQLAEKVTQKPTVVGVKQLFMGWRDVWNYKNGAKIGLSGELHNSIIETIREKVLGETVNTKNIGVDTVLNFKDGEVWRVTRVIGNTSNPRGFFVKPHDAKTKKANTSIEIELKPDFLQKNLKSINEDQEQLDEKLITFSNRAPYGQVVFIAGGAGCFSESTPIKTENGYKSISKIKKGDMVYSYNEETREQELKPVLEVYSYKLNELPGNQKMLELKFDNGVEIHCTENHEFYIDGKWVMAKDIELGTDL